MQVDTETLIHAFISSRLDCRDILLSGASNKADGHLQLAAARILTKTRERTRITPILKSLHWSPVYHRIHFKIPTPVLKSLNGHAPSYLSDMVIKHVPAWPLRSSDSNPSIVPKVGTE